MDRTTLAPVFVTYSVIAGGVTVIPLAYLYGRAIVLLLIASLFVVSLLHARTGTGPTMTMEGGGGESDYTELDASQSIVGTSYSLPGSGRTALTFYLVGLILWCLGTAPFVI
ncbi:hypothetical protein ZOD2009_13956 [Haladaptatus paucihalophilus DX253]|uniref:DUF8070 domain-containing protein n=1 Tax=Haladaptatus paucihalophilus DX253 TaxID=797209 RepID=E7QVF5_HALPU|nr:MULTISPECIES: hypothetical protein [Haladaptatus]EFW91477.1 hypothetical protein ZOD2009_13956 [Haladaptatus paucihalophilus DX253]GKZ15451.1 hypothetical protein HAL_33320 [Haladaptatus sp. T7]SHL31514.1 hypothetical protein SAMN05444342_3495 [Haladaptatus paucihalophilus DX253]